FVRLANSAVVFFFFSSRRRHTRSKRDWSSDVCSSDLSQHPRQSSQPAFTISLDVYSFPSETSARSISLNIYVFSSVLIFCPDLRSEERRVGIGCIPLWEYYRSRESSTGGNGVVVGVRG